MSKKGTALKGFEKYRVRLPGLLLEVDLPPNTFFRNDGVVDSIDGHTAKIRKEFGIKGKIERSMGPNDVPYGRTYSFPLVDGDGKVLEKASIIYIINNGNTINTLNLGHESTHAAIFLDEDKMIQKQLMNDLYKKGFDINPFEKYTNEEDICNLFGVFSVYKLKERKGKGMEEVEKIAKRSLYDYKGTRQIHENYARAARELMRSYER